MRPETLIVQETVTPVRESIVDRQPLSHDPPADLISSQGHVEIARQKNWRGSCGAEHLEVRKELAVYS